jgi:myo-inositol-1(or 4)-monophosphatase
LLATDVDPRAQRKRLVAALREAGQVALTTFRGSLRHWTKGKESPVSEADIAVNDLLHQRLLGEAPGYAWLSEETKDDRARTAARLIWIVDPIDGTRAYIAGRTDWSISAALVSDGRPIAAALFAPATDEMFAAVAGGGATLNDAPIEVSSGSKLDGARVAGPQRYLQQFEEISPGSAPVAKIHSLALRLTRVAHAQLDVAFASANSHDWDLAAADLLVHEAGGALTTLGGQRLTYNQLVPVHGALVAAGGDRHPRLIELMRDWPQKFV